MSTPSRVILKLARPAVPVASTLLLVAAGEGVLTWRAAVAAVLVAGGGLLAATARG